VALGHIMWHIVSTLCRPLSKIAVNFFIFNKMAQL
jgi:hypothetical protein